MKKAITEHQCQTCKRDLPKKAFRTRCAKCIKLTAGYAKGSRKHIDTTGKIRWLPYWYKTSPSDVQAMA